MERRFSLRQAHRARLRRRLPRTVIRRFRRLAEKSMRRPILRSVLFSAVALAASPMALGQSVPLSGCRAPFPCAIPSEIRYRPDPLIAGQYGSPSHTALSVRIPVAPMSAPEIDKSQVEVSRAVDAAVHALRRRLPPPKE